MREIRFRAWDKVHKEWLDYSLWDQYILYGNRPGDNNVILEFPDGLEMSQFTGLKDKNGKDIYDGDILKATVLEIVEWKFNRWVMRNNATKRISEFRQIDTAFFEIIGNVYENPELLKENPK